MYEVAFDGWTRTPEEIKRCKRDRWYRWNLHRQRLIKTIRYKGSWWRLSGVFVGFILNRKRDFI